MIASYFFLGKHGNCHVVVVCAYSSSSLSPSWCPDTSNGCSVAHQRTSQTPCTEMKKMCTTGNLSLQAKGPVSLRNLKYLCICCVGKGVTEFLMARRNTLPSGLGSEMFMDNSSPIQGQRGWTIYTIFIVFEQWSVRDCTYFFCPALIPSLSWRARNLTWICERQITNGLFGGGGRLLRNSPITGSWPSKWRHQWSRNGNACTSVIYAIVAGCLCEFLRCICFPFSRALFIELINWLIDWPFYSCALSCLAF